MLKHLVLASALALGGCYATPDADYAIGVEPTVAYIAPGVEVVTNFDYPVFYADNFYWRWYGGYWYRSTYWGGGWVYAPVAPLAVRGIARPWSYAHYRPSYRYNARPAPRPVIRDHRRR